VIGNGRPFSVRVYNPKIRGLGIIKIKDNGVTATLAVSEKFLESQTHFLIKARVYVKCENTLEKADLRKLSSLAGSDVTFENKSKLITKKVYSMHTRQIASNEMVLTMVVDGGLMIKQFVSGEEYCYKSKNISEILGTKCKCVTFDVLDVVAFVQ
jgi:tRNA U54 and U55 pseudouridine synthase Pus10